MLTWSNFIGQRNIKRELQAIIAEGAAPSILLRGGYGCGKTTLAKMTAASIGPYIYYDCPPKEVSQLGDIIIIDEIHLEVQPERLYKMMDGKMFIFCTTEGAELPNPFKSRCIELYFSPYTVGNIALIVLNSFYNNDTYVELSQAIEIAKRCHNNPRLALLTSQRIWRLLKYDKKPFNLNAILEEFDALGIDIWGFDDRHRAYLMYLNKMNRAVGLGTLSNALNIDKKTLTLEIEPPIIQRGLVQVTPRGRLICHQK